MHAEDTRLLHGDKMTNTVVFGLHFSSLTTVLPLQYGANYICYYIAPQYIVRIHMQQLTVWTELPTSASILHKPDDQQYTVCNVERHWEIVSLIPPFIFFFSYLLLLTWTRKLLFFFSSSFSNVFFEPITLHVSSAHVSGTGSHSGFLCVLAFNWLKIFCDL